MHVQQQIALALAAAVSAIPDLDGRVYTKGSISWDRRTFPMAAVTAGETKVTTRQSGVGVLSGRPQTRRSVFVVEIHDLETAGDDHVVRMMALSAAVEAAVTASHNAVPLVDLLLVKDSGVSELDTDEDGVHAASALTFEATYLTVEGRPDAFVEPDF